MHDLLASLEQNWLASLVHQIDSRHHRASGGRPVLGVKNADTRQPGHLVRGRDDRFAFHEVDQADMAFPICQQRLDMRIPTGQHLPRGHNLALLHP